VAVVVAAWAGIAPRAAVITVATTVVHIRMGLFMSLSKGERA
jgi:hypothetical protein